MILLLRFPKLSIILKIILLGMAGVDNPLNVKTYEYARYVIFNDHCYTPLTSPSQKHTRNSESPEPIPSLNAEIKTSTPNASKSPRRGLKPNVNKEHSAAANESNKSIEKDESDGGGSQHEDSETEEDSYSSGNVSSENDRDSDLDFNIYDRPYARSKKPSRRGRRRKGINAAGKIDKKKRQSTSSNIDREIESLFGEDVGENSRKGKKLLSKKHRMTVGSEEKKNNKNPHIKKQMNMKEKVKLVSGASSGSANQYLLSPTQRSSGSNSLSDSTKSILDDSMPKTDLNTSKSSDINVSHQSHQHHHHNQKSESPSKSYHGNSNVSVVKSHTNENQQTGVHHHASTVMSPGILQMPPLAQIKPNPTVSVQKKRTVAPHVDALYSDIQSLFSTPDIIKKVGNEQNKINIGTPTTHITSIGQTSQLSSAPALIVSSPIILGKSNTPLHSTYSHVSNATLSTHIIQTSNSPHTQTIRAGFMALNPPNNKNPRNAQLPSQISIQMHNSNVELASEQDKQLDLIDSIVQQELEQSSIMSSQMNEDIPNIVKMLENNPLDTMNTSSILGNVIHPTQQTSQFDVTSVNNMANMNTNLTLPNIEYNLDSLANTDDGLTEDLLKHVAVLAENKNLQEIIDKQVLGVQNNVPLTLNVLPSEPPQSSAIMSVMDHSTGIINISQENITHNKQPKTPVQNINQQLNKSASKDLNVERKIIRPDGRVITLPPMEAPTTRAKRRAQAQPTDDKQKTNSTNVSTPAIVQKEESNSKVSKKVAGNTSRNVSVDSKDSKTSRRSSVSVSSVTSTAASQHHSKSAAAAASAHDTDDAMDSDDSWNSEDDPDRLWCICKQPHNNRFMICCDSCEEWFHGKCVNITKAMGQQMEEKGVEWTCPTCLKKKHQGSSVDVSLINYYYFQLFQLLLYTY